MKLRAQQRPVANADMSRGSVQSYTRVPVPAATSALSNQALQCLLAAGTQAKLTVSDPGDEHEREADRIADAVVAEVNVKPSGVDASGSTQVQRKCAACEQEEELQAKAQPGHTPQLDARTASGVEGLGAGHTLPAGTRAFFEARLGHDLGAVRIHADAHAGQIARAIDARAFTVGRDIAFAPGEYAPATLEGRRLLAHELTHVVQQRQAAAPVVQREAAELTSLRFSAEGVNVVVRRSCAPATFGFANVETATRDALDAIFNTDCIEESRRRRVQRNLTAHGLDIRCVRSATIEGDCAEATGFDIPANIMSVGSASFVGHPDSSPGCQPLESTILHEIIHLTRGVFAEPLPASCEAACFGVGGADPALCRDIDVFGRRPAAAAPAP